MKIEQMNGKQVNSTANSNACKKVIDSILAAETDDSFVRQLADLYNSFGTVLVKCELINWMDVMNRCDEILARATAPKFEGSKLLFVDSDNSLKEKVKIVLNFTSFIFENTYSRGVYSSTERLLALLNTTDIQLLYNVSHTIFMIARRSKFLISHASVDHQKELACKLFTLARSWQIVFNDVKMCELYGTNYEELKAFQVPLKIFFKDSTVKLGKVSFKDSTMKLDKINIFGKNMFNEMDKMMSEKGLTEEEEIVTIISIFRLCRALTHGALDICNLIHLVTVSNIAYLRGLFEEWQLQSIIHEKLIEEIARLLINDLSLPFKSADFLKSEALRTLTGFITSDRSIKLVTIFDSLGGRHYHGFLGQMTRKCAHVLKSQLIGNEIGVSSQYCTAFLSLLYHIGSTDNGAEILKSCGIIDTLLHVVDSDIYSLEYITYITRAVRIIDIVSGVENNAITVNSLQIIVNRIVNEIKICVGNEGNNLNETSLEVCSQQRAALLKSLINFLKKVVNYVQFADNVRFLVEGDLPNALSTIIRNHRFFCTSLFHNTVMLTSNLINQEPSAFSLIQEKGLSDALISAFFENNKIPPQEMISLLCVVTGTLTINQIGLEQFLAAKPFEKTLNFILSANFLMSMKKRRGDTNEEIANIARVFEEFLRNQPSQYPVVASAISMMLDKLLYLTSLDENRCVIGTFANKGGKAVATVFERSGNDNDEERLLASGENSEDEDEQQVVQENGNGIQPNTSREKDDFSASLVTSNEETFLPLGDYLVVGLQTLQSILQSASADLINCLVQEQDCVKKIANLFFVKQIPLDSTQYYTFLQTVTQILRLFVVSNNALCEEVISPFRVQLRFALTLLSKYFSGEASKPVNTDLLNRSLISIDRQKILERIVFGKIPLLLYSVSLFASTISTCSKFVANIPSLVSALIKNLWKEVPNGFDDLSCINALGNLLILIVPELLKIRFQRAIEDEGCDSQTAIDCKFDAEELHFLERCERDINLLFTSTVKLALINLNKERRLDQDPEPSASTQVVHDIFNIYRKLLQIGFEVHDDTHAGIFLTYVVDALKDVILLDKSPCQLSLAAFYYTKCEKCLWDLFRRVQQVNKLTENALSQTLTLYEPILNWSLLKSSQVALPKIRFDTKVFSAEIYFKYVRQLLYANLNGCKRASILQSPKFFSNFLTTFVSLFKEVDLEEDQKASAINNTRESDIQRLVEMGFERDEAIDALWRHSNINEATDYLLANANVTNRGFSLTTENEDAESFQILNHALHEFANMKNYPADEILETRDVIVQVCFKQLTQLPAKDGMLYDFANFLRFGSAYFGNNWIESVLLKTYLTDDIIEAIKMIKKEQSEEHIKIVSTRLHLTRLIGDLYSRDCVLFYRQVLIETLISLLEYILADTSNLDKMQPVLQPLLFWLDFHDKMITIECDREEMFIVTKDVEWMYWDVLEHGSGWITFSTDLSSVITKAFYEGKADVQVVMNGQKYTINFLSLTIKGVKSSAERPVTVFGRLNEKHKKKDDINEVEKNAADVQNWRDRLRSEILPNLIKILNNSAKLHEGIVQSTVLLLANVTRHQDIAKTFHSRNGIESLLKMCGKAENSTESCISIIIHYCIDNDAFLNKVFERAIHDFGKQSVVVNANDPRTVRTTSDYLYIMRQMRSLCFRNPTIFTSVVTRVGCVSNGDFSTKEIPAVHTSSQNCRPVVKQVLKYLLKCIGDETWDDNIQTLSRGALMKLFHELLHTYRVTSIILEPFCETSTSTVLMFILEKYFSNYSSLQNDFCKNVKVFVKELVTSSSLAKVQESFVTCLIDSFYDGLEESDRKGINMRAIAFCELLIASRDLLRLIAKYKHTALLVDIIRFLNYAHKNDFEAPNSILRLLEELTRVTNSSMPESRNTNQRSIRLAPRSPINPRISEEAAADRVQEHRNRQDLPNADRNSNAIDDNQMDFNEHDGGNYLDHDVIHAVDTDETNGSQDDDDDDDDNDENDDVDEDDENDDENDDDGDDEEEDYVPVDDAHEDEADEDQERRARSEEEMDLDDEIDEDELAIDEYFDAQAFFGDFAEWNSSLRTNLSASLYVSFSELDSRPFSSQLDSYLHHQSESNQSAPSLSAQPNRIGGNQSAAHRRLGILGLHRQGAIRRISHLMYNSNNVFDFIRRNDLTNTIQVVAGTQGWQNFFASPSLRLINATNSGDGQRVEPHALPIFERIQQAHRMMNSTASLFKWIVISARITDVLHDVEKAEHDSKKTNETEKVENESTNREANQPAAENVFSSQDVQDFVSDMLQSVEPEVTSGWNQFVRRNDYLEGDASRGANHSFFPMPTSEAVPLYMDMEVGTVDANDPNEIDTFEEATDDDNPTERQESEILPSEDDASPGQSVTNGEQFESTPAIDLTLSVPPSSQSEPEDLFANEQEQINETANASANNVHLAETAEESVDDVYIAEHGFVEHSEENDQNQPSTSQAADEYRHILGDIEIPEGVDPSFLAALPDNIREEVLRDHAQQLIRTNAANRTRNIPANLPPNVEMDPDTIEMLPQDVQDDIFRNLSLTNRENERLPNEDSSQSLEELRGQATAVIESLQPELRAEILAEADEGTLQHLPTEIVAEAHRLRSAVEEEHYQQMLNHPGRLLTRRMGTGAEYGALAGSANTASSTNPDVLDKDSILILTALFFLDPSCVSLLRLQRVMKNICAKDSTCEFVIWSLLAILDKLDGETKAGKFNAIDIETDTWLNNFRIIGNDHHSQIQILKVFDFGRKAKIHPAMVNIIGRVILDMLAQIARWYSGHFLPSALRNSTNRTPVVSTIPHFSDYWEEIYRLSKCTLVKKDLSKVDFPSKCLSVGSLEESALAVLIKFTEKNLFKNVSSLQEKLLKLILLIFQTLPHNSYSKLQEGNEEKKGEENKIEEDKTEESKAEESKAEESKAEESKADVDSDEAGITMDEKVEVVKRKILFADELSKLIEIILFGEASDESIKDIRQILLEASRAISIENKVFIHTMLMNTFEQLGSSLLKEIYELDLKLQCTLNEIDSGSQSDQASVSSGSPLRRNLSGLYLGKTSSKPLGSRSDSVDFTDSSKIQALIDNLISKNGVQNRFVKILQTLIKIRETLAVSSLSNESRDVSSWNKTISSMLSENIHELWRILSTCLKKLESIDSHAALILQPAAEAFFLIYTSSLEKTKIELGKQNDHPDALKLFAFAEQHRGVLNQVLRQSDNTISDGPFAVLLQVPRLLEFDVKRKYFRKQIQRSEDRIRNRSITLRIRRSHLFSDSYRELYRLKGPDWKSRFHIIFSGEEGQDAGGLLREWFTIITREIFNPNYALFSTAPGDRVTYMINRSSFINVEHLDYFRFVGRFIAKAIYDNKVLDCYFTRAFYKHILGIPVRTQDLESEDPDMYKSLVFLLNNPLDIFGTDLTFALEVEEFGVREVRPLKEDGMSTPVTEQTKEEYVKLVCLMKMTGSIKAQLKAFLDGFYEIIPKNLISIFNEQELELLICGLPTIDIDDLYANTEYRIYTKSSPQIVWFWKALRSFEQEDRAKFLQFVTGTSKVPLQGFSALEGMSGVQKFSIHMDSSSPNHLPSSHTCFNQLDLPQYETYEKLREMLLLAIRECSEGFGFA